MQWGYFMNRDLQKAIADYKKKFDNNKCRKGIFYASDFYQIKDISNGEYWGSISNALMAGFMIGYRTAKRNK